MTIGDKVKIKNRNYWVVLVLYGKLAGKFIGENSKGEFHLLDIPPCDTHQKHRRNEQRPASVWNDPANFTVTLEDSRQEDMDADPDEVEW